SNPVVVQLSTKVVASARTAQIIVHNEPTATQTSKNAFVTVNPPTPTAVVLGAPTATGGQTVSGTVQLNASAPASLNIPISLLSSDPTTATVPASVIASGTAVPFSITTAVVPSSRSVTISATTGGQTKSASLTVNPPVPQSLVLAQTPVVAQVPDTATLTLTAAPPVPATATVQCSDVALLCPTSVAVSGTVAKF